MAKSVVCGGLTYFSEIFFASVFTLVSSAAGLAAPADLRPAVMGARAASMQFGYFAGSLAAGAALASGGYAALGLVVSVAFVAAAGVLMPPPRVSCPRLCAQDAI